MQQSSPKTASASEAPRKQVQPYIKPQLEPLRAWQVTTAQLISLPINP